MAQAKTGPASGAEAPRSAHNPLTSARRTLTLEIGGLKALADSLDGTFAEAVDVLAEAAGRVIVTGMGKSGHVARKIAATLASTGTPAQFVHPGEASHGDLGMITADDAVVALSWAGESIELRDLIDYSRRFSIPLVAITAGETSALAEAADVVLLLPKAEEACPNGLAPTTSTTMQLALGDALAIALLERNGFSTHDYKQFHPGGKLGAVLRHVSDIMHTGAALPLTGPKTPMSEALITMTEKRLGVIGIVDDQGRLAGIITDGDLRRHMGDGLLSRTAGDIMTAEPKSIAPETLAAEALNMLNTLKITCLFVVEDGRPVGLVHLHDFLRSGVA